MRNLALRYAPLRPDDAGEIVFMRFSEDPNCLLLAVVDEAARPVGLVERNDFLTRLAGLYGRSTYGQRPISLIMDTQPLIVDADEPAGDFAEMALAQFSDKLLKGFIIVENGHYFGVGTVVDLLKSAILERTCNARRLERLAHHDTLTGLANRARLHDRLAELLDTAQLGGRPIAHQQVALLAIDLDRFKIVNDTYGHDAGDRVLRQVADRITTGLRPSDMAARLGGDEFAILLPCGDAPHTAETVAARIVGLLSEPFWLGDKWVFLGGSVGIATCPQDARDAGELMKFADMALYRAKRDGRGVWRRFCANLRADLEQRGALEADLHQALARNQFAVHLQPILNLADDTIIGFEALMRWDHPVYGFIPPATFIPMAEEIGLICTLGDWMIHQACWLLAQLPEDQSVAVNVSSVQFRLPGLVASVTQAVARAGIAPDRLELEITESVLIGDEDQVRRSIHQLQSLGVRIALDDFGTGFASFAYLQRFPFNKIKIDRTFTSGLPNSPQSRAIISAVSVLGQQLGMIVTVEGVETAAQLAAVRQLGCQQAQGYHIGMPMPAVFDALHHDSPAEDTVAEDPAAEDTGANDAPEIAEPTHRAA